MAVKYINNVKCYPFNGGKNQHNIDFAIVRTRNLMWDAREAGDMAEYARLEAWLDKLGEAYQWCSAYGICYMPYQVWKVAKDACEWAKHERAARCYDSGVRYVE